MTNASLGSRAVIVALGLTVSGCGLTAKVDLWRVLTSGRDGYQQPEKVVAALALAPGARVAEIGAGDGYWLPWLSEAVGDTGRVYAVEVEDDKAEELRESVERDGCANVEVILGRYEDPLLPDGGVDLAMTSLTYHHIEDRIDYFRRLRTDLAPGGRVAHLDDRPDLPFPLSWITSGHTSDPRTIKSEMAEAGYRLVEELDFLYVQSFTIYAPE